MGIERPIAARVEQASLAYLEQTGTSISQEVSDIYDALSAQH